MAVKVTGEERIMSVRIIVSDESKILEREMNVRSFETIEPETVKSLSDLLVKALVSDVKGWRDSPQSKGQLELDAEDA